MATKILLIEDEPLLVSLYAMVLAKAGYEVQTACDAETGEEKVIVVRPHVILLDLLIPKAPGQDVSSITLHEPIGFEILRLVKNTPSLQDTRVIVLSNLDSDEHIKKAETLGADGYVVKASLDPHNLAAEVEKALQRTIPLAE